MSKLSEEIAGLSPAQRAILEARLKDRRAARAHTAAIPLRGGRAGARLSFGQQRLWFLDRLEPGNPFYNIPAAFHLRGALDAVVLGRCIDEIVRRHEVLRTSFEAGTDGLPVQVVAPSVRSVLTLRDLSNFSPAEREAEVARQAREEARRPFDLTKCPLLRVSLSRLAEDEHVLLYTMHHIISDAWSMGVLAREVAQLYRAYSAGEPSPLAELPVQYADFAEWQRGLWDGGSGSDEQLSYWRRRLEDAPPELELWTDRPRPAAQSYRGERHSVALSAELTEELQALGREENATLFMTMLAAWQLLLHRYTGQEDVIVGTDIVCRNRVETEGMIGFFVNTLVLRTDVSGGPCFRELLGRVRSVCLGAFANQEMPFDKLVEELRPERSLSRNPLFQVALTVQNAQPPEAALPGLTLTPVKVESGRSQFDLALNLRHGGRGIDGWLEYSTDLFDPPTIERLVSHFQNLVRTVVARPDESVARLPLLSEGERRQLLDEWSRAESSELDALLFHRLFEAQVERRPDAPAASFEGARLSYRELNRRANRVAWSLIEQGVKCDDVVALLAGRGVHLLTAMLAVFKAGAAYLPLDPLHPAKRNSRLIEQSGAAIVLSTGELASSLASSPDGGAASILDIEGLAADGGRDENPPPAGVPESLAYVIYTSGSTGVPKGAMVEHRGMLNHLRAKALALSLSEADAVAQTASQCFDISVWQYLAPLLVGGCVRIFGDEVAHDPARLFAECEREVVTILEVVPSLLRAMLEDGRTHAPGGREWASLRWLLVTGEALPPDLCRSWLAAHPSVPLLNAYGPTECSDDVTHHEIFDPPPEEAVNVPIGRPVLNARLYILDSQMQPVPHGVAGELHVGGVCVGRGYLGDAARTAGVFVTDPFGGEPGARLYRTGDRARHLPDGRIEFLGRVDHQVKVRGFRIELGEIEAVLRQHAAVRDAVVLTHADARGDKRLVAYVVVQQGEVLAAESVRGHLRERLPEYMIPSALVTLERLPLTPNGKLDRGALPVPNAAVGDDYVAPRTPVEEVTAGVWAEVLRVERVGLRDNFFELGGHSLLATQVVSRLREALGVEVGLRALFEAPTVEGLAAAAQAGLAAGMRVQAPPISRAERGGELPLSFAQQRLWFLHQLEPDDPSYNLPAAFRLIGRLDIGALERSLGELVRRHEVLRTTFPSDGGQPRQLVGPAKLRPLNVDDLRHLSEAERAAEAERVMDEEARRPFDLARGPLYRVRLLRLGEAEHALLYTMHHIVSDGWSLGVLLKEVSALYRAYTRGEESPLAELPIQYGDYAVWQREWLQGEVLEAQLAYWREQLAGAPPALDLPTDRPRPPVPTASGARLNLRLPAELTRRLRELSRAEHATLYMTLLAAFKSLLSRYTGQDDIVVGTPIAGRARPEIEGLLGFFLNTLVLRTDLSGDPTFAELVGRVRAVCLDAYAHQDVPFERVVEELQPDRDTSHSPLFQVLFAFDAVPPEKYGLEGLRLEEVATRSGALNFDITLTLDDKGSYLAGVLGYKTDLFDASTMERMVRHFEALLEAVVADPAQTISELKILSEGERVQLLTGWNDTAVEYPRDRCLHELFEEQAERTPHAVAVALGEERITYGELNRRANQLACCLRRRGVKSEARVGLMFERSVEMVVALLGILKAGGAYAPLDPALPRERLRFMVEDAGIEVLLTQEHLRDRLEACAADVLTFDSASEELARASVENAPSGATAANLAYVIYTSGSTGVPKGVMVQHSSPINLLVGLERAVYSVRPAGPLRASVNAPLSFDASVQQLLLLLRGHALHVVPQEIRTDGEALLSYLARNKVDVFDCTPSQLGVLLSAGLLESGAASPSLMLVAGEAMDTQMWETLAGAPRREFFNIYGPTECTVDVTARRVRGAGGVPTIGRPLANTEIFLLDAQMRLVPAGVAGELYVGGDNLARGYLDRPGLTAEKFVPHPYTRLGGARLYRTGDRARYRADGDIEFLGRLDHQVKVRGFRIELGEIEAVLCQHAAVRDAVVLTPADARGDKRLVAYVVMQPGEVLAAESVRGHLRERLPEYMIPSAFVTLERLPLTPAGKLDRRALPEPAAAVAPGGRHVAARTPVEEAVAGVWAEVLGVERVGVHDNFFDLGGHSLLATQAVSRIRATFGVELALRSLFETPTPAGLAACVEGALRAEQGMRPTPVERVPRDESLPLSFAQERLWFIQYMEPDSAANNIPAGVRLRGRLDVEALGQSINELVRRHEVLRTRFSLSAGGPAQHVMEPAPFALAVLDLSREPAAAREEEARRLAVEEAYKPFDLSSEPPFRVRLLRLGEDDHLLLYTLHHIASDAWSLGIIIREVALLYEASLDGRMSPLAELPVQYADYAVWQRGWLRGEVLEKQLAYWRGQLLGAPESLELTTDRPRPPARSSRGATETFQLPRELTEALKALGRSEGATLFITLLAAFAVLLHRYSEQEDIVIGTGIANRGRPEAEHLIGCFFNLLALRTRPAADLTFRALLSQVRETTLGAYAHQDLPFEKVLTLLQLKRDPARTPLFQVMFVFQNTEKRVVELPGLTLSPVRLDSPVAKFDLTLFMEEDGGRLYGEWEYSLDLFDGHTMRRMLEHWQHLLQDIAAHPDRGLKNLSLAPDDEADPLVYAFNDDLES
jgi:amino acid adenylation domain-containing protein